ncbi:hypothetical protein [Chishuiella sp.]|uniref:hypothetical protein n=1 Tax=Chishuiella sp. TaxID=1969467 RepID=UPI0028AFB75C|nr:hypothetical protein [Chishuiella sp.]
MLDNGIIWIDTDGKIIAINYQSDSEKNLLEDLIKNEKQELYISIRNFAKPVYKIQTKSYLIRIDELKNGSYRYVSWKRGSLESSKPDLILENGELDFEGSGGNSVIVFTNKNYTYKIFSNIIGTEETADVSLLVEKNNNEILSQDGILLK